VSEEAGEELFEDRWILERTLGLGAMGQVFRARYASTGFPCAIKLLLAEHRDHEEIVTRFLNEAQVSNRIGHPGVCRVIDTGWTREELPFLIMELLEGASLEDTLGRGDGLMAIGEAMRIAIQLLDVLIAAHELGILHRDIKPDNVFVTREGAIKLLDFGVAKMPGANITQVGAALGTVGYMSPENALSTTFSGAKADVWSVGATLFRLLSGELPVQFPTGAGHLELLRASATSPARRLSACLPRAPQRVVAALAGMLAFDPENRMSAAEAHAALTAIDIPPEQIGQVAPWVWDPRAAIRDPGQSQGAMQLGELGVDALPAHSSVGASSRHDEAEQEEIEELHRKLDAAPDQPALLHALVELYVHGEDLGAATTIARTLRFIGEANTAELELAEARDGAYQPPSGQLSRRQWRETLMVGHPSAPLSALLARLWPALAFDRRRDYEDMNIELDAGLDVGVNEPGLPRWIAYLAAVLDTPTPALVPVDDPQIGLELVAPTVDQTPIPTLLAGPSALAPQPAPARAFRCGYALALTHPYLIASVLLPSSTGLRDAIHGATLLTWPKVTIPAAQAGEAETWRQLIERLLVPERIEALRRSVERVVQTGGDTRGWLRGCSYTAARVGLLVSGDLDVAAELLRAGVVQSRVAPEELIRELVGFSVSAAHLELRRALELQ